METAKISINAALELARSVGAEINVIGDEKEAEAKNGPILCLGSNTSNNISCKVFANLKREDFFIEFSSNELIFQFYGPIQKYQGTKEIDFAILSRFIINNRFYFVCAGIDGEGTVAAAHYLIDKWKILPQKQFILVLKCFRDPPGVCDNGVLIKWKLNLERNAWEAGEWVVKAYFNFSGLSPASAVAERFQNEVERRFNEELFTEKGVQIYKNALASCRESISQLTGAQNSDDIGILPNASFGLNAAMSMMHLKAKDVVITSDQEHPSVTRPLAQLKCQGVEIIEIATPSKNEFLEELKSQVEKKRVNLIITSHVSYKDGRVLPIYEIGKIANAVGVPFIVDGAQAVGQVEVDIKKVQPSVYVFSGHKILCGPMGTGGLWASQEFLKSNRNIWSTWATENNCPNHPFEVGTINIRLTSGLDAAIKDYLSNKNKRETCLLSHKEIISRELSKIEELVPMKWFDEQAPGILTYLIPDHMNPKEFTDRLICEHSVAVKPFKDNELKNGIRVSLSHIIKIEDIKKLVAAFHQEFYVAQKGSLKKNPSPTLV